MFCWHKWSKWKKYAEVGLQQRSPFSKDMLPYSENMQKRMCAKCGKMQIEIIERR